MRTSLCCFEFDVVGDGLDTLVDRARARAGVDGLTLAVAYHQGRDVFPHNPRGRALFLDGDSIAFRPNNAQYDPQGPRPRPSQLALERDTLAATVENAHRHDLGVRAWLVYLHNESIGRSDSELAVRSAFGDLDNTQLCPANPRVQRYAAALTADVCRYPIQGILAESLHFHPFDYGYQHQRDFLARDAFTNFLLSLCFCRHCATAAGPFGVDIEALAADVRGHVDLALEASVSEDRESGARVRESANQLSARTDFAGFLESRTRSVADLLSQVGAAADRAGVSVSVVDPSGALPDPLTDRRPVSARSPGWEWGLDVSALGAGLEIEAVGYSFHASEVEQLLASYAAHGVRTNLALRPMFPDCSNVGNLREKITVARTRGVSTLDFYHYGLAPLTVLDRIAAAIS